MLKIFNLMDVFFEDVYREISVRQYAKLKKLTPPTASKILKEYKNQNLLILNKRGIYLFFRANKEHYLFKGISQLYWQNRLYNLTKELSEEILNRKIILFGSVIKSENTVNSDIDLFIDLPHKEINVDKIEKQLNRKVQLHFKDALKNEYLRNNIEKGVIIR